MEPLHSTRPAIDAALSSREWVDALCRDLATRSAPLVVEALAGFRPRCLFLGGSAALGEALGWESRGGAGAPAQAAGLSRLLLSDLDLGLITEDEVPAEERRRLRERLAASAGEALSTHRAAFAGIGSRSCPVGLGLYVRSHVPRQQPTLGLIDAARGGRVLWGDPDGPAKFALPAPAAAPAFEAWRLVGNRALERLLAERGPVRRDGFAAPPASQGEEARRVLGRYARAKMAAGLWTARLVLRGEYRVGWRARARLLEEAPLAEPADPLVACAAGFRRFLEEADEAVLPPEPEQRGLLLAGLEAWLCDAARRAGIAPGDPPEDGFLEEPVTARDRYRLWKLEARRDAGTGALWMRGFAGLLRGGKGTPEGRRMAAAVLYWRLVGAAEAGERPGSGAPAAVAARFGEGTPADDEVAHALRDWADGARRYLGAGPPAGLALAERLARLADAAEGS